MRAIHKITAALFAALLAGCAGGGGIPQTGGTPSTAAGRGMPVQYAAAMQRMGAWLANSAMLKDGATAYSATKINPYFANIAATGLSKDAAYVDAARSWMQWYVAHLNTTDRWGLHNSIYDYQILADGTELSLGDADSVDSYAATFLTLARNLYDSGDTLSIAFLSSRREVIYGIADAILALQQADGLTIAKPDVPMEYLMDNTEVYRGLNDAAYLSATAFADPAHQTTYALASARVARGIEALWDPLTSTYAPWKQGTLKGSVSWNTWYPDATSQLFPILNGIISPTDQRAATLYEHFNQQFPAWSSLQIPDSFPWALLADVAAIMNDTTRAGAYLQAVDQKYGPQYAWPWYCGEGGWYMRAAHALLSGTQTIAQN